MKGSRLNGEGEPCLVCGVPLSRTEAARAPYYLDVPGWAHWKCALEEEKKLGGRENFLDKVRRGGYSPKRGDSEPSPRNN